jgi:hypothetical protein
VAIFNRPAAPAPFINEKQRRILDEIAREKRAIGREIAAKLEADRKLDPLVKEYEEILKAQEILDELNRE